MGRPGLQAAKKYRSDSRYKKGKPNSGHRHLSPTLSDIGACSPGSASV